MRLSIGSVVVVLVAPKGSVWVCRFFAENTTRQLAGGLEIFCKTGGLNLNTHKTRIYLCHRNSNGRMESHDLKLIKQQKKNR